MDIKKMLTVATAVIGTVAVADVVSSSVVGYAKSELKNGNTMVSAQFTNVSGGAMPLQSIVPQGDDLSDNIAVATLDAAGYTVDTYVWNDWSFDEPCWVNDEFEKVNGVTIAQGCALWVQASSVAQALQSAGKVETEDVVVQLKNGNTGVGNPFPVGVDLQEIIPEGEDLSDNIAIATLDAAGYTADTYVWNDWSFDNPCWVNDEFEKVEGVTIGPGQGLWVQGSSVSQSLRFPAPEL